MSDELKIAELTEIIYSDCGVEIRYCDCQTIARKLVEKGYEPKGN